MTIVAADKRRRLNASIIRTGTLAISAGAWACHAPPAERVCQAYGSTAFSLRVQDARTGTPIARGAVVTLIHNGRPWQDHTLEADDVIYAIFGEAGRYDFRVTKAGYQAWERRQVLAPDVDGCGHTSEADLIARLEPER